MAGIRLLNVPGSGLLERRLMLREGQSATKNFSLNGDNFRKTPKPKFLFFVRFNSPFTADALPTGLVDGKSLSNPHEGIVFPLKAIDRPKMQPNTETLNQYNKKRIIQTKIDYQSVTMRFHDDIEDKVMKFWADYYAFYYGDGNRISTLEWAPDIVTGDFEYGNNGWGFRGRYPDAIPQNQHYLDSIEIIQFFGGKYTKMTFVRPIITMFDHDEADYAEGATGSGIIMQFDYEGIIYDLHKKQLTPEDGDLYGFVDDWYNTESTSTLDSIFSNGGSPYLTGSGIRDMFRGGGLLGNTLNGLTLRTGLPPTGADLITGSILRTARTSIDNGTPVFKNLGQSFGQGAYGLAAQSLGTSVNVIQISGITAAARSTNDLPNKQAGISSSINNFGQTKNPPGGSAITGIPSSLNSGTSATKLSEASSTLSTMSDNLMTNVNESNNVTTTQKSGENFSTAYGGAANLAVQQNLVSSLSTSSSDLNEETLSSNAVVTKLPDGKFALTQRGAAVMNSLRQPTSAVGTRMTQNPWKNPSQYNNTSRALNLEKKRRV